MHSRSMRIGYQQALSIIGAILFWTWTIVQVILNWIGRSTVVDDFNLLMERLPAWAGWLFSTPWWVPTLLATTLTAFLIWLSWPRFGRAPTENSLDAPPTEQVFDKHYRNEKVWLDGKSFYNCLFENVSFIWDGGRWEMKQCTLRGNHEILSKNRIINQTIKLMLNLGFQGAKKIESRYYPADAINPADGSLSRPRPPDTEPEKQP